MKSLLAVVGLAACLALAGCFTSEQPLFDQATGSPIFGKGVLEVTTYEDGQDPDSGRLQWTPNGYVDAEKADDGTMSFHRLPGEGPFSSWYVGESKSGKDEGYMYMLYRKQGARLYGYDVSCKDLTVAEAAAAHLVRQDDGDTCVATRAEDIGQAFRLLAKRKQAKSYMVARPAPAGASK